MLFILLLFFVVFLFNLYVVIFGKQDIQALKNKLSISKYLSEINNSLKHAVGDEIAKWLKVVLILLLLMVVIFNIYFFIGCLIALILGTFAAKKAYQYPWTSNIINKIATYINRLR